MIANSLNAPIQFGPLQIQFKGAIDASAQLTGTSAILDFNQ